MALACKAGGEGGGCWCSLINIGGQSAVTRSLCQQITDNNNSAGVTSYGKQRHIPSGTQEIHPVFVSVKQQDIFLCVFELHTVLDVSV